MRDAYEVEKLQGWLEDIEKANNTLTFIEEEYGVGIDFEDDAGEREFTFRQMEQLDHLLYGLKEALESEIKYYEGKDGEGLA